MFSKNNLKKMAYFAVKVYAVILLVDVLRPKGLAKQEEKLKETFGVDESFLSSINPFD